jgi:hypothetical protein
MLLDVIAAGVVRGTGLSLEAVFFAGYLLSMALIWAALLLIGSRVYTSAWATAALAAVYSLRHHIPRTSANTFEPYFHPRMLAFGLGALAVAAVVRRRSWTAVALVAVAAVVHVTTALWFAILVGVALARLDPLMRRLGLLAVVLTVAGAAWALTAGPLRTSMATMDPVWLQPLGSRNFVFPQSWPLWPWLANLGLLAVLLAAHRVRRRRGVATDEETALVWGATALVAVFLASVPLVGRHLAFPSQLQISRVFWLVDFVATVYVIGAVMPWRRWMTVLVVAIAVGRGAWIMGVDHAERGLFALRLPDTPWQDAMRWIARQPLDVAVLADQGHAWKYGSSVRVAAGRDVFLEEVKDSSIALYSRQVAVRVLDRIQAIGDFAALTADRANDLAVRYDLDYLVSERRLPLPLVYHNAQFTIYRLRADGKLK